MSNPNSKRTVASVFAYASLFMGIAGFCAWVEDLRIVFAIPAILFAIIAFILKYKGKIPIIGIVLGVLTIGVWLNYQDYKTDSMKQRSDQRMSEFKQKQNEMGLEAAEDHFSEERNKMLSDPNIPENKKIAAAVGRFWGMEMYYYEGYYNICKQYGVDITPLLNEYSKINATLAQKTIQKAKSIGITKSQYIDINKKNNTQHINEIAKVGFDSELHYVSVEAGTQITGKQYCELIVWCILEDTECAENYDFSIIEPYVTKILEQ